MYVISISLYDKVKVCVYFSLCVWRACMFTYVCKPEFDAGCFPQVSHFIEAGSLNSAC